MKLIKCNLQGQKHKRREQPCEDSVAWQEKDGVFAVSVADGAGSSKYTEARDGSQVVSETACKLLVSHFDELYEMANEFELRRIIEVVCKKALSEKAKSLGLDSYETMASTLLAVAVSKNRVIAIHIGDGIIGRLENGVAHVLTVPRNGEFAGTTFFITQEDSYAYLQVQRFVLNAESHLFLMTDGIADHIYNEAKGSFSNALLKMLSFSDDPQGEENLKLFVEKNIVDISASSDDSTIAVLCTDERTHVATDTVVDDRSLQDELGGADEPQKPKKNTLVLKIGAMVAIALAFGTVGFLIGNRLNVRDELSKSETVAIELYETVGSKEIGNNQKALLGGIVLGDTVAFDPRIRNTGGQLVFAYLEIKMFNCSDADAEEIPMFSLMHNGQKELSGNWTLLQESVDELGEITAVYGYNDILEAGDSTDALFNEVSYLSSLENRFDSEVGKTSDDNDASKKKQRDIMTISAVAIPADANASGMIGAWNHYCNQNAMSESATEVTSVAVSIATKKQYDETLAEETTVSSENGYKEDKYKMGEANYE